MPHTHATLLAAVEFGQSSPVKQAPDVRGFRNLLKLRGQTLFSRRLVPKVRKTPIPDTYPQSQNRGESISGAS